ncbi:hypothetical protein D3C72_1575780 [compost metagenome]
MQPRLLVELLPLESDWLVDLARVVFLLHLPPCPVPSSPSHLSRLCSVRIDQRNGRAQVVRQHVPDGQRMGFFRLGLGVFEGLDRFLHLPPHLLRQQR